MLFQFNVFLLLTQLFLCGYVTHSNKLMHNLNRPIYIHANINVPELAGWVGKCWKASVEDDVAVEFELSGVIFIVGVEADVKMFTLKKVSEFNLALKHLKLSIMNNAAS